VSSIRGSPYQRVVNRASARARTPPSPPPPRVVCDHGHRPRAWWGVTPEVTTPPVEDRGTTKPKSLFRLGTQRTLTNITKIDSRPEVRHAPPPPQLQLREYRSSYRSRTRGGSRRRENAPGPQHCFFRLTVCGDVPCGTSIPRVTDLAEPASWVGAARASVCGHGQAKMLRDSPVAVRRSHWRRMVRC